MPETPRHREVVRIGRGRLPVSRLGLGTAALGGLYEAVDDATSDALVAAACAAGIRYVDTAPLYGHGRAERRLGRMLAADTPAGLVVSTKVGRVLRPVARPPESVFRDPDPYEVAFDFTADGIRRAFADSLTRLGVDRVDLLYLHDPDDYPEQALTEAYPALARLRDEGAIGAIGLGMNQSALPTRFVHETDLDVVLLAGRYTLLDQSAQQDLLPAARQRGVSVVVGGVFNSGVLMDPEHGSYNYLPAAEPVRRRARAVREVAEAYGVPVAAAGLQFPLRHPAVDAVLIGPRSVGELHHSIEAFNQPVPAQLWRELAERELVAPVTAGH